MTRILHVYTIITELQTGDTENHRTTARNRQPTILFRNFNTPLHLTEEADDKSINQYRLIDIYAPRHTTVAKYIFLLNVHKLFTDIT